MTILGKIVTARRAQIESYERKVPWADLQQELTVNDRNFLQALRTPTPAFILECKSASPSRGVLRPTLDLKQIAESYGRYASAISVLTEPEHFGGSFEHLADLRHRVQQPLLCKDFITTQYHVGLARHHGASAILLILAALDDDQYRQLSATAYDWSMHVLTEVSNADEAERAVALGASIIGINNRDLRDLSVDTRRTHALARQLRNRALLISESGFETHAQVRAFANVVDGFLVGSSLMSEPNLDLAVRRFIFGEHKICGLTQAADATVAASAGACFGGLIFVEASPRRVSNEAAEEMVRDVGLKFVGVFQDQPVGTIVEQVRKLNLAAVQLHGDETVSFIQTLRGEIEADVEIWKAITVDQIDAWANAPVDRIVIDHRVGTQRGGTGIAFDWSRLPPRGRERMMIAGGLSAKNAVAAGQLGCAGLDFNSGVEASPGIKDHEKIRAVFSALRQTKSLVSELSDADF